MENNCSKHPRFCQLAAAPNAKVRKFNGRRMKDDEVFISDLPAMWLWLRKHRITVNAMYARMCWRRVLPASM